MPILNAKYRASATVWLSPPLFCDITESRLVVGQEFKQEILDCFTLEVGTDRTSRNFGKQLPTYTT